MLDHFNETRITRNYDVVATGFSSNPPLPQDLTKPLEKVPSKTKDILFLFSSIAIASIGYGILIALFSFKMEKYIKSEILMSFAAIAQIGAGVSFARFLPEIGRRLGLVNSIYAGSLVSAACALIAFFYFGYISWLITIYVFGIALFTCGVTRQTIMINLAPPHMKAMVISLGGMIVAIGNAFGPILLNLLKTGDSFASYLIACLFYLISMLPLRKIKDTQEQVKEEKRIGILRYIQNSPKIMFAGFCVNYSVSSATAFLIIYGIRTGMSPSDASLLYSVLLFGTIFSIPLGYLTDIVNRRFLMIFSGFLSLICVTILFFNHDINHIYFLLFLTFGCMTGVKLPAVVLINEKYKATQRLAVNSAFAKFSLMGNICGIFSTGLIMKLFGPQGLWGSLLFIMSFFVLFCVHNYIGKFMRKELDFSKFSFSNKSRME